MIPRNPTWIQHSVPHAKARRSRLAPPTSVPKLCASTIATLSTSATAPPPCISRATSTVLVVGSSSSTNLASSSASTLAISSFSPPRASRTLTFLSPPAKSDVPSCSTWLVDLRDTMLRACRHKMPGQQVRMVQMRSESTMKGERSVGRTDGDSIARWRSFTSSTLTNRRHFTRVFAIIRSNGTSPYPLSHVWRVTRQILTTIMRLLEGNHFARVRRMKSGRILVPTSMFLRHIRTRDNILLCRLVNISFIGSYN